MFRKAVRAVWKILPARSRLRIVRATQGKFTVSAAAVVLNADNKVLLLNHVLRPLSGWGLPGGFVGRGEQPEAAVRREIREETGLELEALRLLRVRVVARHVEILFTATSAGEARVGSREIFELGWYGEGELPRDLSHAQREIIRQVLRGEI